MSVVDEALALSGSILAPNTAEEEAPREAPLATNPADTATATAAATATAVNTAGDSNSDVVMGSVALSAESAARRESFRVELKLYMSGNEIDVSPCYVALERVFKNPGITEADQDARDDLLKKLLNCIEGKRLPPYLLSPMLGTPPLPELSPRQQSFAPSIFPTIRKRRDADICFVIASRVQEGSSKKPLQAWIFGA